MGRAVGGSSAVGCGAFGIVGLLVGVGLTVWLGSMALSGSTDGGDGPKPPEATPEISTLDSAIDDLQSPVPGLEPSGATLEVPAEVAANGDLPLRGTDLSPGPIRVSTCLAATDAPACDPATAVELVVGGDGRLAADIPIHRVITIDGTAYDCAARPGACMLFGQRPDNPLDTGLPAALTFAAGLPPVDAIAPPA